MSALSATLEGAVKVRQASAGSGVAGEVDHIVTLLRGDMASALETELEDKSLTLRMVNPDLSYQERRARDPFGAEYMVTVRYFYNDGALYRQFQSDDRNETDLMLELHDFEVARDGGLIKAGFVQKTPGALKRYDYSFRKAES